MNYEKYLLAAGVPQELHQQALEYMAKCEQLDALFIQAGGIAL